MAILFDFDGTLFDTSHDIHAAVNQLLKEQNKPEVDYAAVRTLISEGSKAILAKVTEFPEEHRARLLEICLEHDFPKSLPFPGIEELLSTLDRKSIPWGIVTNRSTALTMPILERRGYTNRPHCVVCGDTTDKSKPHPKPLLHAANLLNILPQKCVYIGDAKTDIEAGKAAGMHTVAAGFGFINPAEPITSWQADHIVNSPVDILPWIEQWLVD